VQAENSLHVCGGRRERERERERKSGKAPSFLSQYIDTGKPSGNAAER
jgi:hypothetical protein